MVLIISLVGAVILIAVGRKNNTTDYIGPTSILIHIFCFYVVFFALGGRDSVDPEFFNDWSLLIRLHTIFVLTGMGIVEGMSHGKK